RFIGSARRDRRDRIFDGAASRACALVPTGFAMKRIIILTTCALALAASTFAAPATMRVDYYHTGNEKQEYFSLDRIVLAPSPWPGTLARSIDKTNLGKYFFEVIDAASGTTLYSRGFASVYGEWETTGEAQKMNRPFSESLRSPAVDKPA